MTPTLVGAPAKVNLTLRVGPRRPDGYHQLATVFMAVGLADQVTCTPLDDGRIVVDISGEGAALLPRDGTDLTGRAAALLRARYGHPGLGVHLQVDKAIPVAAGMAGGSADAAAALRGCNDAWDLGVDDDGLDALAAELGADVPFALMGGVAYGLGRGDKLVPLPCTGQYHWVLALAHEGLSTARVFAAHDALVAAVEATGDTPHSGLAATGNLVVALGIGDAARLGAQLANDLTDAAISLRPELGDTLRAGAAMPGVLGAVLSGSGPTCAFLCDPDAAEDVAARLPALPQVAGTRLVVGPVGGAG